MLDDNRVKYILQHMKKLSHLFDGNIGKMEVTELACRCTDIEFGSETELEQLTIIGQWLVRTARITVSQSVEFQKYIHGIKRRDTDAIASTNDNRSDGTN